MPVEQKLHILVRCSILWVLKSVTSRFRQGPGARKVAWWGNAAMVTGCDERDLKRTSKNAALGRYDIIPISMDTPHVPSNTIAAAIGSPRNVKARRTLKPALLLRPFLTPCYSNGCTNRPEASRHPNTDKKTSVRLPR